ncbi:MAG TPA: pyruvate kinase [Candidatus Pullichristensenella avicola]|nr:pyruvate kinase [Candidatus Pullichristensenella avicola]
MRKTKIVCTIGPACDNEDTLTQMCLAGMNVARLNFSHGTHEEHLQKIERIRRVREQLNQPIAIMLDTKGPEYRTGRLAEGRVMLSRGDRFTFTTEDILGDRTRVSVSYKGLPAEMAAGDTILVNNGLMVFEVTDCTDTEVNCTVVAGGELTDRKSMSFPGKVLKQPYLSEQDKADIRFGVENDVDFIACSFVSRREDLEAVHAWLDELGAKNIDVIAKLENRSGVDNIEEICEACDGIMIGRGDMGVEIPFEELPQIQKHLITKCRMLGKRVITATEMLESMIHNVRPTRAEISDVANAVYDGTSAIMLSGETAAGEHPVLAVETMSRIASQTESGIHYEKRFLQSEFKIRNIVDAISHATCGMSIDVGAKAIAVCSLSGKTVRMVSRFRSPVDILGVTTNEKTWRKLALSWGVTPVMCEAFESTEVLFYSAKRLARKTFNLQKGDRIVITAGATTGRSGNTNLIKIETI